MMLLKKYGVHFAAKDNGCWECTSHRPNNNGYPMKHGETISRFLYRKLMNEIPDGFCVLHTCDNRLCIRPDHLWLGTRADNNRDKVEKGRQAKLAGSQNPRAKLTEEQIPKIRADRRGIKQIAADYGVSNQMISRIRRREAWNAV